MTESEKKPYKEQIKDQILEISQSIIDNKTDILESCWDIKYLWWRADLPLDDIYNFFSLIESETDTIPTREMRSRCSKEFLERKDREKEQYVRYMKDEIIKMCATIIEKYGKEGKK